MNLLAKRFVSVVQLRIYTHAEMMFSRHLLARLTPPRATPGIHSSLTRSITSASHRRLAGIYGHISVTVLRFSSNGIFLDAAPFLGMTWASARRFRSSRFSLLSCVNLGRYRIKSDGGTAFRSSRIAKSGGKAESYPHLTTNGPLRSSLRLTLL